MANQLCNVKMYQYNIIYENKIMVILYEALCDMSVYLNGNNVISIPNEMINVQCCMNNQ